MTIEQKALELVNAVKASAKIDVQLPAACGAPTMYRALLASIEAHEADKARHAAELREQAERFSEAAQEAIRLFAIGRGSGADVLSPFILAPVDPLVEAMSEAMCGIPGEDYTQPAADLRAALEARGLSIVAKAPE